MDKLSDAELSLAVARIMVPDFNWKISLGEAVAPEHEISGREIYRLSFDCTTDDALGKMCVWLALEQTRVRYVDDPIREFAWRIEGLLASGSPHRAIAEAIVEASNG
ncbi:MAG: hypothetical protein KAR40_11345 [Candidatus Sabulitectum sp.]|nr:hypothetical protein [Candidatus Sabulitectum sp.]